MVSGGSKKMDVVQSFLVVHQGALGDFILALPALESIRKAFPHARSAIMGYPRILELVEKRFYAEEIFSIDQKGMATFFVREGVLDFRLSEFFKRYDLIVVFGRDGGGTIVDNLRRVCQGQIIPIDSFPPWDGEVHLTDHLLKQFTSFGLPASDSNPRMHLNESDREWARDFWKRKGVTLEERSKVIVLHPGSGSKKKVWPLDRFVTLARTLQSHFGSKVLVILGPAEGPEVRGAFEAIRSTEFIMAKGLTLLQLGSVMEGCWFYVGNDSGVSHLAAALELPMIVIFGPTDQRVWSPKGKKTFVVRRAVPCSPCPQERFFKCKGFECLQGIEMGEVLKGLEKIGVEFKS
jgi:ADP-heptose:LPS heptosyltransferase